MVMGGGPPLSALAAPDTAHTQTPCRRRRALALQSTSACTSRLVLNMGETLEMTLGMQMGVQRYNPP